LPIAAEIARSLKLPLDIAVIRKVGAPGQPELAVAAISLNPHLQMTVNHDVARLLGLDHQDIRMLAEREMPELVRRQKAYRGNRPPVALAGKTVILVDDGVATGATARAALRLIADAGARRIILALPVAPRETVKELENEADLVICLAMPTPFFAVGAHYRDFDQVSDAEVTQILQDISGK
jgi:putative phosphoribosyl transferase